ncbi:MAG TPA: Rnf-Nqr domain containing protein [Feifaniaceae bacterium]|nr:Rnf-Nqr domain containing protein [Feifaniaceae bacterium]
MKQKKLTAAFFGGLLPDAPALRLAVALCAALAVAATASNGLGLGLVTALVLACSNAVIALVRGLLPEQARPFAYALVIGLFVSAAQMLLAAYFPGLSADLGIYVPLTAISCILLSRVGADEKPRVAAACADGLVTGLLFAAALFLFSAVRELLGFGTLFGAAVFGEGFEPMLVIKAVPGGLILLGVLCGIVNHFIRKGKASDAQEGGIKA